MSSQRFDYIVVGAGAAGSVVAGRLSENPNVSVLLLEAGMDVPPGAEPPDIRDPFPEALGNARYAWPNLIASVGPDRGDGRGSFARTWIQGRVVGGGSSVNGMLAQRGAPSDFEEWASLGATGWSWADVLPFYKRLETDLDYDGPAHGADGPVPIRRYRREQWPAFIRAIVAALEADGLPFTPDIHAGHDDGVSRAAMNNRWDRRVGAAQAYLGGMVRARRNLAILPDSMAETVMFEGRKAIGVRVRRASGLEEFFADEIILSGGAIQTPALLMRSGVGPAEALAKVGVRPRLDCPGVGQGLQNHPGFHLATHLPRASAQPAALRAPFHMMARFSSGYPDCPETDLAAFAVPRAAWHPLGARIGAISTFVHKPYSRGSVELTSPDPEVMPRIDFRLLSAPRDFARLMIGAKRMLRALAHPETRAVVNECFLPSGGHANAFNTPTRANWWKSWAATRLFDMGTPARVTLLRRSLIDPAKLASDDAALAEAIRETAACVHHPTGTCRMGRPDDPQTVVDPRGRVRGVDGLRVADTSIMPTIVTAGTHISALMIGEKIADMVKADARAAQAAG